MRYDLQVMLTALPKTLVTLYYSSGVRQSILSLSGNTLSAGFSAVAIIVITRALGPDEFGEFSIGWAILMVLTRMNDLGLTFAVQKFVGRSHDHQYNNTIFSASLRLKLIVSSLCAGSGLLLTPHIQELLNISNQNILLASFISLPIVVLYDHFQAMLQALHRFQQSVLFAINQALIKMIIALVVYFFASINAVGALLLLGYAPLVPIIGYRFFFPQWLHIQLLQSNAATFNLLKTTATHSAVGYIAIGLIENSDVFFVQHYLSSFETGLLAGISKISLLITLLAYSLASVLNPRASRYKNLQDIKLFTQKAALFVVLCAGGYLSLLPFLPLIITLTIGPDYLPGEWLLSIALGASFFTLASIPFVATFFAYDHPWVFSLFGLSQLAITILGNSIFVPIVGLHGAIWTRVASQSTLLVLAISVSLYYYHTQKKQRKHVHQSQSI